MVSPSKHQSSVNLSCTYNQVRRPNVMVRGSLFVVCLLVCHNSAMPPAAERLLGVVMATITSERSRDSARCTRVCAGDASKSTF